MEKVALNNVQLDRFADSQPTLKPYFHGTVSCDRLPTPPDRKGPVAYILNTDQGQPDDIGWPCGLATTNARSWTVTLYHWRPA